MSFGRPSARLALLFAPALLIVTLLLSLPALAQDAALEFVGQLQAQTATTITVNGVTIDITSAEIDGPLTVGALVKVEAALINNQYVAREVDASGDDDLQPNEIELIGFVQAIDGTTLLVGGQLIDLTSAEVGAGIDIGAVVKVHVTTSETGNWVARQVALFDPAGGDNDDLDNNDDFGNDDLDNNDDFGNDDLDNNDDFGDDDENEDFELAGTLESVGDGFIIISGQQFDVSQAEVKGVLAVGSLVRVEFEQVNGQWVIVEVRSAANDGGNNDDDGNDDGNDDAGNLDNFDNDDNGIIGNNDDDDDDDDDNFVCGQVPNGWTTYSIQQGDTLSGLASRTGTSLSAIVGVNCVANPNSVPIGAILAVPRTPSDRQLFVGNDDDLFDNNDDDDEDDDLFGNNDDDDDDDDDNSGPGNNDDDDDDNSGPGNNDDDDDDDNSGSGGDNDDGGGNNDDDDDDDNSGSGGGDDDDDDDD